MKTFYVNKPQLFYAGIGLGKKRLAITLERKRYTPDLLRLLFLGDQVYSLNFPRVRRWMEWLRVQIIPTFYGVGYYCCDTQRYHYFFPAWVWGNKALRKASEDWDRGSDGPARVYRITLCAFIKWRIENHRSRREWSV